MNGFWDVFGIPLEACGVALIVMLPYVLWPVYSWKIYQLLDNRAARKLQRRQQEDDERWAVEMRKELAAWDGYLPHDMTDDSRTR